MPFKKGRTKTGGKIKGVSKHKITKNVVELLDKLKCNPIEGMARIAVDPKADLNLRGHMYSRLARYTNAEIRQIELSGPGGGPIQHDVNTSSRELLENRIARLSARAGAEEVPSEPDGSAE